MTTKRLGWWAAVLLAGVAVASLPACNRRVASPDPDRAPLDFELLDVNGAPVKLASFAGRPLVVNFWATWCGPCRQEIPWFVEFAETYHDRGLQIVGISVDDTPADIAAFMKEYGVTYPMLVGAGHDELFRAFEAESFYPVTWIVRADGTVQAKTLGMKERDWFKQNIEAAL